MGFEQNRLQAICFDVDGTLRDTDDQLVQRLTRLLRPLAFAMRSRQPKDLARRIVMAIENPGNFLLTSSDWLGIDAALNWMSDWLSGASSAKTHKPAPMIEGTYEMLRALQADFPLAIVSSRGFKITMDFLNQHKLLSFFQFVATSQTCQHTKPWPDPIIRAAQEMRVPVQACLMVGDTTIDIRAGKACGAQTAGVLCGFGEELELREAGADLILAHTKDLLTVLYS